MKVRIGGKVALTADKIPNADKDPCGYPNPYLWRAASKILGELWWVRV